MNPRQLLFTGQCGRIVIPAVLRPQLYAHPARRFWTYPGPCAMSAQPPPSNNGPSPSGPSTVTSQQTVRTPQQLVRRWVRLEQQSTSGPQHSAKLRLLSWNLLADGLAQWGDFIRVKPEYLEWAYRKPLILHEVLQSQADVLCFQELNYFGEVQEALAPHGYSGVFLPKRHSPATKYNSPVDGVALFWRADKLDLLDEQSCHFTDSTGQPASQGCILALLSVKPHNGTKVPQRVLVATTHLKAKEGNELDAVRLGQMQQLLQHVTSMLNKHGEPEVASTSEPSATQGQRTPVVVAGDLNTTPSSLPCKLLASPPWSFHSIWDAQTVSNGLNGNTSSVSDSTDGEQMCTNYPDTTASLATTSQNGEHADTSVCASDLATGQTEFSTWKFRSAGESKRIIDHVWYTGLVPQQRWRMLSESEIGCDGLPCDKYPSDHIALCCEFEFKQRTDS